MKRLPGVEPDVAQVPGVIGGCVPVDTHRVVRWSRGAPVVSVVGSICFGVDENTFFRNLHKNLTGHVTSISRQTDGEKRKACWNSENPFAHCGRDATPVVDA